MSSTESPSGQRQTSKRTSSSSGSSGQGQRRQRSSSSGSEAAKPRQIAAHAAQALQELTGKDPESVTALQRTDDGWTVQLEVVESRRIPDTADIMAVYEVDTDASGELTGYRRRRRYNRGHTGEE